LDVEVPQRRVVLDRRAVPETLEQVRREPGAFRDELGQPLRQRRDRERRRGNRQPGEDARAASLPGGLVDEVGWLTRSAPPIS
jgi:hypothetical protein